MVDEDLTHHPRAHSEEMRTVLKSCVLPTGKPDVGLVDQRSRLQRVISAFASHVTSRKTLQFGEDDRPKLFPGGLVAIAPLLKQPRHIDRRHRFHKLVSARRLSH